MRKLFLIIIFLFTYTSAWCPGAPFTPQPEIRSGHNPGFYEYNDGRDKFTEIILHLKSGMGTAFINLMAIDITPEYRTINYSRDEILIRGIATRISLKDFIIHIK